MSTPNREMLPEDNESCPPMAETRVDFPAPLGPISPTILPVGTSMSAPSSARTPPKCRIAPCTLTALVSEVIFGTTHRRAGANGSCRSLTRVTRHLSRLTHRESTREPAQPPSSLRDDSLRSEPQEQQRQRPDNHPFECGGLGRVTERRDVAGNLLEEHRNEETSHDHARIVAGAPHHNRGE